MKIKEELRKAIDARNAVSFLYNNEYERIVEPHHYGIQLMTPRYKFIKAPQEDALLCWQIGGESKSNIKTGKPIEFKTFKLNLISNFRINEQENFEIRDKYNPADKKWKIEYGVTDSPNYTPPRK